MSNLVEATPAQGQVIDHSLDARVFVIAGPGAGKTWTLLQRAGRLTSRDDLEVSELLVLSFTRAVVAELRKRDRGAPDPSRIRPETFDAFATRLLAEHAEDERWITAGYEGRIEAATRLLRDGAAESTLAQVRHVLLDEVQDLVGARSEFVEALLQAHKGGFTAFGDPAQAIYDHERGSVGGPDITIKLIIELADKVQELDGNHRASPELAAMARGLREVLLDEAEDEDEIHRAVQDAFGDLHTRGQFESLGEELSAGSAAETAVLCRDNATALRLSEQLHARGLRHRVRRGTADRPVAGWVAAMLSDRTSLSRDKAEERHAELQALAFPGLPDQQEAWRLLNRLDPRARGGAVRAAEIGSRIAAGICPWELYDEPGEKLIISSIHRAKGLEFDDCLVVEWPQWENGDRGLEARVLFVALTRARRDCWHVDLPGRARWFRSSEARDRFIKGGFKKWQTFGIEVRGEDAYDVEPGGSFLLNGDAKAVQQTLIESVRPGDPIRLDYLSDYDFGRGDRPVYAIVHDMGTIGVTGPPLGDALRPRLWKDGRPSTITSVRVHDLETVKGDSMIGQAADLGRSGVWLRPRLIGLGEFNWGTKNG